MKFWILGSSRKTQLNGGISRTTSLAIHEKPANLSILKGSSFTSITSMWGCSGHDNCKQAGDCFPIYTLTDSGLMQFRESLRLIFVFKILRHSCFLDWHDVLATSSISFLSVYLHFAPYSFSFCLQAFYTLLILGCWSKSLWPWRYVQLFIIFVINLSMPKVPFQKEILMDEMLWCNWPVET